MQVVAGLVIAGTLALVGFLLSGGGGGDSAGGLPSPDGPDIDPDDGPDLDPDDGPDIDPDDGPSLGIIGVPTPPALPATPLPGVGPITPLPGISAGTAGTPLNATDTPQRGRWLRIKWGDTLSKIAKAMRAQDPTMTAVEWQQFINSANSEFWSPPQGAYYESVFPNGYMGKAFLPQWSGSNIVETNAQPGNKYPAIYIP